MQNSQIFKFEVIPDILQYFGNALIRSVFVVIATENGAGGSLR